MNDTAAPTDIDPNLRPRVREFTSWSVPEGFATYDIVQVIGQHEHHHGVAHVYDDGELRIIVRPGNREGYTSGSYYMSIPSMLGEPGQSFSNVHAALCEARRVAMEHERMVFLRAATEA